MITPLSRISLHDLLETPVLFDANIFMVGIDKRHSDNNYSFAAMKENFIKPLFESFKKVYIHEEVYKELDAEAQGFLESYIGKNVTVVGENNLYGKDPYYTTIFNNIANHELVQYSRGKSKNRGEVYSLAYAVYHNMNYFCSKEIMVDNVAHELQELRDVEIITFDVVLLNAYIFHNAHNDTSHNKALRAIYKRYCADVIKRHKLPSTLSEYIRESVCYL